MPARQARAKAVLQIVDHAAIHLSSRGRTRHSPCAPFEGGLARVIFRGRVVNTRRWGSWWRRPRCDGEHGCRWGSIWARGGSGSCSCQSRGRRSRRRPWAPGARRRGVYSGGPLLSGDSRRWTHALSGAGSCSQGARSTWRRSPWWWPEWSELRRGPSSPAPAVTRAFDRPPAPGRSGVPDSRLRARGRRGRRSRAPVRPRQSPHRRCRSRCHTC